MDQRPPSTEGATPVDDDIALDMTRVLGNAPLEAPETPASAVPGIAEPMSASDRHLASLRRENAAADLRLTAIEHQKIVTQEIAQEERNHINAVYEATVAAAARIRDKDLARNIEDEAEDIAALDAEKADLTRTFLARQLTIEGLAHGGAA